MTKTLIVDPSTLAWLPANAAKALSGKTIELKIPELIREMWGQHVATPSTPEPKSHPTIMAAKARRHRRKQHHRQAEA